ncbi:hypothetical protein TNCV_3710111 [Trichonephila clavipes]|nr:hypothetical protein TNCV_3710111 [Trichonephila clavipes]
MDRLKVKDLSPTSENFCKRLRLYIAANCGHFDQKSIQEMTCTKPHVNWTVQLNSAPAHKDKKTQGRCKTNFPVMISSEEWPPNTQVLNSMDCSV